MAPSFLEQKTQGHANKGDACSAPAHTHTHTHLSHADQARTAAREFPGGGKADSLAFRIIFTNTIKCNEYHSSCKHARIQHLCST